MRSALRSAMPAMVVLVLTGTLMLASQPETLVGCLQPGSESGSFVLALDRARQVAVMSTRVGLTEHLGRQVSLVGRQGVFRSAPVFKVIKLDIVDMSCR